MLLILAMSSCDFLDQSLSKLTRPSAPQGAYPVNQTFLSKGFTLLRQRPNGLN